MLARNDETVSVHKKNNDIEVLRAIAIIFVVFSHIGLAFIGQRRWDFYWNHFGLYCGVDLFFAISGYVIAKSYYEKFWSSRESDLLITACGFWIRRAFRLWPSAWLWLVLTTVQICWHNSPAIWANMSDGAAAMLEVANYHWWNCLAGHGQCGGLAIYWSLSLEEQFYMLFPLMFLMPRKYHLSFLLFLAFIQIPVPRQAWSHDLMWFTRTDAVSLGVCVYLFSKTEFYKIITPVFLEQKRISLFVVPGMLVLLAVVSPPVAFLDRTVIPFSTGMIALICAFLVWIASYDRNWCLHVAFFRPFLVWIGGRSYAIYLLHMSAFGMANFIASRDAIQNHVRGRELHLLICATTVLLIYGLAECNRRFVEIPFRVRGAKFASEFEKIYIDRFKGAKGDGS